MAWAFEVGKKLGLRCACFSPASAAFLAMLLRIDSLIQDGVLDEKGWTTRQETLQLAPGMPRIETSLMPWNKAGAPEGQPVIFKLVTGNNRAMDLAEVIVCNSFHEAEAGAFKLYPNEEVSAKVMQVVGDEGIRERVRALKDAACRCLAEGGSSYENFKRFVDLLKE
ncbi:hypothetical protein EJB05_04426, partial [Eragrostis curvula]